MSQSGRFTNHAATATRIRIADSATIREPVGDMIEDAEESVGADLLVV
jgi:hypothetical protein